MRLDPLVRLVRPYTKDCPPLLIEQQLILAARDFCGKTHAYAPATPVMLGVGRSAIDIPQFDGEEFIAVKSVFLDGLEVRSLMRKTLVLDVGAGRPTVFYVSTSGVNDQIIFDRAADQRYRLDVSCVTKPSITATELSDALCNKYGEIIAYGAAADVLLQQNYPWFNPELGGALKGKYEKALSDEKLRVMTGHVSAEARVYSRKW